jgi:hypothetical protein
MITNVRFAVAAAAMDLRMHAIRAAKKISYGENGMGLVPIMWAVWGVSLVFMAGVSIFAARLGRNEEAQIYLADSSNRVKSDQDAILARVNKFRPVKMTALWIAGAMTAIVLVYYLFDIFHQF